MNFYRAKCKNNPAIDKAQFHLCMQLKIVIFTPKKHLD